MQTGTQTMPTTKRSASSRRPYLARPHVAPVAHPDNAHYATMSRTGPCERPYAWGRHRLASLLELRELYRVRDECEHDRAPDDVLEQHRQLAELVPERLRTIEE
jgi:hypothetical protein